MKNRMSPVPISQLDLGIDRDSFVRSVIGELAGTLEDVIGLEETSGFVSLAAQRLGDEMNVAYRRALGRSTLSRAEVADVLVDLKRRVQGDFYVIEQSDEKIVFGNRACPFAEKVIGRPALCMMTSNLFGVVAAENLGWAKVAIEEAIARGAGGCLVVVYLQPTAEAEAARGREYYRA